MFQDQSSFNCPGTNVLSTAIDPSFSTVDLQDPLFLGNRAARNAGAMGSTYEDQMIQTSESQFAAASVTQNSTFNFRLGLTGSVQTFQQGANGLPGQAEHYVMAPTGFEVTFYTRGDEFGSAVETGDFNGDGYMDLVVGSPGEDATAVGMAERSTYEDVPYTPGSGMVTVIYGTATGLTSSNAQNFEVNNASKEFGRTLTTGDFNGDGRDDVAIGGADTYVMYGGVSGLQSTSLKRISGYSQALESGDFDGDGVEDLAIGRPTANNYRGEVTVMYGSSGAGLSSRQQVWSQDSPGIWGRAEGETEPIRHSRDGDQFGFSLAAGDFNGDGKDDLAIGTPGERFAMSRNRNVPGGAVNVIYGSNSGLTAAGNQFWDQNGTEGEQYNLAGGIEAGDEFGYELEAGDFNGDGVDDLAIGIPGEDIGSGAIADQPDGGAVAIVFGQAGQGLTSTKNLLLDQNSPGMPGQVERDDRFGESLSSGDFNGDGYADLAVGIPGEDDRNRTPRAGAVAILYGMPFSYGNGQGISGIAGHPSVERLGFIDQNRFGAGGLEAGDLFGSALAIGDFDGNGSDDLAIGAPGEQVDPLAVYNHAGVVNVLYGTSYLPVVTVNSDHTMLDETGANTGRFMVSQSSNANSVQTVTLRSVGSAQLGIDFAVSGASVNGDLVTVTFPAQGANIATSTEFQVTSLNDSHIDPYESIRFEVVKEAGFTLGSTNTASLTIKDDELMVVDTLVDENDGDFSAGDFSLREAIAAARDTDTVYIAPWLQGSINLNSSLVIDEDLKIDGAGANRLTVSGNDTYRVFEITSDAVVEIEGLTIAHGNTDTNGGGILNQGTLTLNNSVLSKNSAQQYGGGIHNTGTLTINRSTIKDNFAPFGGGGIYGDLGSVTIRNSTIDSNTAVEGGGIYNNSVLTVTNSTLSNNSALHWLAPDLGLALGGGLHQRLGTATLTNTTVSGNQSDFYGAGIYHANGEMSIHYSTIANNTANVAGSGIYHSRLGGPVAIGNSIVAGNHTLSNPIGDVYGSFNSLGYNLIGDTAGAIGFSAVGDRTGYYGRVLDARLGPLQDNGGSTRTHALLFDSPAINGADPTTYAFDQRDVFSEDGRRDIGAFEWQAPSLSISDVSRLEGNNGIINFDFTVSLNSPSWQPVYVTYNTAWDKAFPGSDYAATNGNLIFNPGETRKTVSVRVVGDTMPEADETFFVNLLNPGNARIADTQGVGTILNDDPLVLPTSPASPLIGDALVNSIVFDDSWNVIVPTRKKLDILQALEDDKDLFQ